MLPLWFSKKSALDLVATLDPGDAVLAATLAVLHQQCVSTATHMLELITTCAAQAAAENWVEMVSVVGYAHVWFRHHTRTLGVACCGKAAEGEVLVFWNIGLPFAGNHLQAKGPIMVFYALQSIKLQANGHHHVNSQGNQGL